MVTCSACPPPIEQVCTWPLCFGHASLLTQDEVARLFGSGATGPSTFCVLPHHPVTCLLHPRRKSLDEVARLFGSGAISVNISHRLALEQAPEAFAVMLKRQVGGC
jgi:D-arabinose 1-dehydrogenase-like Zn-dependent alcohol dehydrogenase